VLPAIQLNNLGVVLREQGDLSEAQSLEELALGVFREFLGDDRSTTRIVEGKLRRVEEEMKNAE
jgi:hypothetical protein